jgi:hypothetical protein
MHFNLNEEVFYPPSYHKAKWTATDGKRTHSLKGKSLECWVLNVLQPPKTFALKHSTFFLTAVKTLRLIIFSEKINNFKKPEKLLTFLVQHLPNGIIFYELQTFAKKKKWKTFSENNKRWVKTRKQLSRQRNFIKSEEN